MELFMWGRRCLTPSGDGGTCPLSGDIWEKKLTFPVYKNILLDIKDMREK